MYGIAGLPSEEREILFQNTAAKMGMNAAVIEKDFWVCLTLDYLFHKCPWRKAFAFKGGTSLSKVYCPGGLTVIFFFLNSYCSRCEIQQYHFAIDSLEK